MTIDERLQFLVQSTESLHSSCQKLHAMMRQQAEENRARDGEHQKLRKAIVQGIAAYLAALDSNGNGDEESE
jgi:hypothetical protein